jgi:hypothetical protein
VKGKMRSNFSFFKLLKFLVSLKLKAKSIQPMSSPQSYRQLCFHHHIQDAWTCPPQRSSVLVLEVEVQDHGNAARLWREARETELAF